MADSWKNWYNNRMKNKYNIEPLLESELTPDEARKTVQLLESKTDLSEYEMAMLNRATEIVSQNYRDSLIVELGNKDPNMINQEFDFISRMNVESQKDVIQAQEILKKHGYYTDELDSLYGVNTKASREAFQYDVLNNQKFTINRIIEQAKGLFQNWID
jgi:hypothetical protein